MAPRPPRLMRTETLPQHDLVLPGSPREAAALSLRVVVVGDCHEQACISFYSRTRISLGTSVTLFSLPAQQSRYPLRSPLSGPRAYLYTVSLLQVCQVVATTCYATADPKKQAVSNALHRSVFVLAYVLKANNSLEDARVAASNLRGSCLQWDHDDNEALSAILLDILALFVGDFGNDNAALVRIVSQVQNVDALLNAIKTYRIMIAETVK